MRKSFTRLSSVLVLLLLSIQLAFAIGGPTLATTDGLKPADGVTNVSTTPVFTMTFQDNVVPGIGGTIGLYTGAGVPLKVVQITGTTTDVSNGTVTFNGKTVTISFKGVTFTQGSAYYVLVEGLAIKDGSGAAMATATAFGGDARWNFTIGDFNKPTLATTNGLSPADDATGVLVGANCVITFNEPVQFVDQNSVAAGIQYTQQLGDFAIYKSTSAYDLEEGGDLVSLTMPTLTWTTASQLTINWAVDLDPSTDYYVRVKPNIIEDLVGLKFDGINNNSSWSFKTKVVEAITPAITAGAVLATPHASGALWTNDNFFIDFAEQMFLSKNNPVSSTNLPTTGLITVTDETGAVIPCTITWDATTFTFKLDPYGTAATVLTGNAFTVTIAADVLRDADGNKNALKQVTFNRGDWSAPVISSLTTTNYSGTTFDILVKANEKCTIKYIVVKPTTYDANLADVIGYTTAGATQTGSPVTQIHRNAAGDYQRLVGTTWQTIEVIDSGLITVNDPTLEILERVEGLPATNGQDYEVFAVAYDASTTGVYNPNYSAPGAKPAIAGNVSGVYTTTGRTVDILMPTVWFDGDSTKVGKLLNGTTPPTDGSAAQFALLAKKGKLYLNFNEGIRLANSAAITGDTDIKTFLTVRNNGILVGFTATYNAEAKQIVVVADSAFKSNSVVLVTIAPTKIEDLAGNEFQPSNAALRDQAYLVETYNPVLALFDPIDGKTNFDKNCVLVRFNDQIFVPRDDESTVGQMKQLNNDPTSPYWAGKYFDITEGNATAATATSAPVKNEFNFTVTYTATETSVNICRKAGTAWESETWYYVETEGDLLDANRYTVANGAGIVLANRPAAPNAFNAITTDLNDNQTISFKYKDTKAPDLTFFPESQSTVPTTLVNIDGKTNIPTTERIGVLINEYVNLGFADHINFQTPGAGGLVGPVDANAMRRYFKLMKGTEEIEFDVENLTFFGDSLILYLDPYYKTATGFAEGDFTAGQAYTVQFISSDKEGVADGAYEDDADNYVVRESANFTCMAAPVTPTVTVTYTPTAGSTVPSTTASVVFTFTQPVVVPGGILSNSPDILFGTNVGPVETTTNGIVAPNYLSINYAIAPPALVETTTYRVRVPAGLYSFTNGATWPAADSVFTFTTVDGTAPTLAAPGAILVPVDGATGVQKNTDLIIRFSENVLPVTGKTLYLWESGVSEIMRIDAANVKHIGGDSIKVENVNFGSLLKYNTNYHVIIEPGFVTDAKENPFAGIADPTIWNFTTGVDPAPSYSAFSPKDETVNMNQDWTIKFTEPVMAINNMFIRVYDVTTAMPGTLVESLEVDEDITPIGGYNTTYTIDRDLLDLRWGHTYRMEIQAGAFVDRDGNAVYLCNNTIAAPTAVGSAVPAVQANWVITFDDMTVPTVKFWPTANEIQIPYNSYLYIQFNEPIALNDGSAIITDPTVIAQNIPSFITLAYGAGPTTVPTKVEFVGNQKRTLRITPLDPAGHNYTGDANATMQTQTAYNLALASTFGVYTLVDTAGNALVGTPAVTFTTEDITAPVVSAVATSFSDANSAKIDFTINEAGTVWVYIMPGTPTTAPDAATVKANAQWTKAYTNATFAGLKTTDDIVLGETIGSKTYTAYVVAQDDEQDRYLTPDPTMWIFTDTPDNVDRIRDILPARLNTSAVAGPSAIITCDDDAPKVVAKSPAHLGVNVPVDANIYVTFNEDITYANIANGLVKLRKAKNNALVAATVSVVTGDSLLINPDANLEVETSYYVEIDRYSILDATSCSALNYGEWVGKDSLYFTTLDNVSPVVDSTLPLDNATCIATQLGQLKLYISDSNPISKRGGDGRSVMIYRGTSSTTGTLLEVIPVSDARVGTSTETVAGVTKKIMTVDVSGFVFLPDDNYTVVLSAGSIQDSYGNYNYTTTAGYSNTTPAPQEWNFSTIDNVPPVMTWSLFNWNTYFNNSTAGEVGIKRYLSTFDTGVAGETVNAAPTHSVLKIDFDENIEVKTANNTWVPLANYNPATPSSYTGSTTDAILSKAEIFAQLKVGDLVFKDNAYNQLKIYSVTASSIVLGMDTLVSQLLTAATLDAATSDPDLDYVGSLMSNASYAVTFNAGSISDPLNCVGQRIVNTQTNVVTLVTRDDTPPALTMSVCENTCNSATGEFHLQFNKPVVKSSYDIVWLDHESHTADNLLLANADIAFTGNDPLTGNGRYLELKKVGGASVAIKDIRIDADMKNIYFTPAAALESNTNYEIIFNKWTVKEYIVNNPGGTLFEGDSCTFHVYDYKAPAVAAAGLDPVDGAFDINSDRTSISVTFDEKIMAGTGKLEVRRENGSIFKEVNITDCTRNTAHTKLTIPLGKPLEDFTYYYVVMPAGFVQDTVACANGNDFPGFSAKLDPVTGELISADWNFRTSDKTAPELLSNATGALVGLNPVPGDVNVPKNSNLVLTFDENISIIPSATAGLVIYYDNGQDVNSDFGNAIEFIPWNSPLITVSGSDIYNNFTSNVLTVNPTTVFDKLGTYYVRANGDNVRDLPGYVTGFNLWTSSTNVLLDEVKDEEWKFTITNDVAPVLVSTVPAYDGVNAATTYVTLEDDNEGAVTADLTMNFQDGNGNDLTVARGDASRKLRIYEYVYNPTTSLWNDKLWLELPITDASIDFVGNKVIVNDVKLRDGINGDSVYYVTVDPGAVLNGFAGSQTFWPGIINGLRWRFQTASDDTFVGTPDILTPNIVENGDDAKNLNKVDASTLAVKFEEGIESMGGIVEVWDLEADTLVEAVTVTDAMVDVETLTVPLTKLYDETTFFVWVKGGAVADTSTIPTPNPAFGGASVWSFQTGDYTNPVPATTFPIDGATCVGSTIDLKLTYNESNGVVLNSGNIEIKNAAGVSVGTIGTPVVDGKVVTVNVTELPDTTALTVTVPAGFVLDGSVNANVSPVYTFDFTTGENTAPTVVSVSPAIAQSADVNVTIKFSEEVTVVAGKSITINGVAIPVDSLTTTDDINYTVAVTGLPSETTVDVVIAAGVFNDKATCAANTVAATTETFDVADIVAPTADYYPATAGDYRDVVLTIDFNETVAKATGDVVVYNKATDAVVETIPVDRFESTNGTTFTYTTNALFFGEYYVLIDAGTFVDATAAPVAVEYAGIDSDSVWTIVIADDVFNDCAQIVSPYDGEPGVELSTSLVVKFDCEIIKPNVDGFVYVAKQSEEGVYTSIQIVESMISADGHTLTIPVEGLEEMTTYSVTIPYGAIIDEAGNKYLGIYDANTWNFTTGDFTKPVVSVVAATVNNLTGTASITSNELGGVFLVEAGVGANQAAITAAIAANKAVAAVNVTAGTAVEVSTKGLVEGTYRAVAIDVNGNIGESVETVIVQAIDVVKISDIQGTGAESPLKDQVITTVGVVFGKDANGFFIQDAIAAWSGVYVYAKDVAATVGIGTGIKVTGKVVEYFGLTEITNVIAAEYVAPIISVSALTVANADVKAEKYEGVYVKLTDNVVTTTLADNFGEWTATSNAGQVIKIDEQLFEYTPEANQRYWVYGIVNYTYDEFKLAPRNEGDIQKAVGVPEMNLAISVYPTLFENTINLKVSSDVKLTKAVFTNIAGQIVKEVSNPENTIATSELRSGVYFISLHTESGIAKTERIIKR